MLMLPCESMLNALRQLKANCRNHPAPSKQLPEQCRQCRTLPPVTLRFAFPAFGMIRPAYTHPMICTFEIVRFFKNTIYP